VSGIAPVEAEKVTGFWRNLMLELEVVDEPEGAAPIATLTIA
jgi:hypothetical protein